MGADFSGTIIEAGKGLFVGVGLKLRIVPAFVNILKSMFKVRYDRITI